MLYANYLRFLVRRRVVVVELLLLLLLGLW